MSKMKGRRPLRHSAIDELNADAAVPEAFKAVSDAFDDWADGGDIGVAMAALSELGESVDRLQPAHPSDTEFTRRDRLVWTTAKFAEATKLVNDLALVQQRVQGHRDALFAQILAAAAVPPEIPAYGVRFVRGLIAAGAGQVDLHPATRRRLRDTLGVLRNAAPTNSKEDAVHHPLPPVRRWEDLPRTFAGFRLEDTESDESFGGPDPLPPYTDIAEFTSDGLPPVECASRRETYISWSNIIKDWAERQTAGPDASSIPVHGSLVRAWVLLLGHRLDVPEQVVPQAVGLVMRSPWDPEKAVKSVWVGNN